MCAMFLCTEVRVNSSVASEEYVTHMRNLVRRVQRVKDVIPNGHDKLNRLMIA